MTKFNQPSFSSPANSSRYVENWERTFRPQEDGEPTEAYTNQDGWPLDDAYTGFDKYLAEQMKDPEFAKEFTEFSKILDDDREDFLDEMISEEPGLEEKVNATLKNLRTAGLEHVLAVSYENYLADRLEEEKQRVAELEERVAYLEAVNENQQATIADAQEMLATVFTGAEIDSANELAYKRGHAEAVKAIVAWLRDKARHNSSHKEDAILIESGAYLPKEGDS